MPSCRPGSSSRRRWCGARARSRTRTLSELAASEGISPFHACAAFRAATGRTLHGHLLEVRLRHALAWLLDTSEPVARIALDAGFASQAHLTTRFRRRFGVTPAACRREGRIGDGGLPTG